MKTALNTVLGEEKHESAIRLFLSKHSKEILEASDRSLIYENNLTHFFTLDSEAAAKGTRVPRGTAAAVLTAGAMTNQQAANISGLGESTIRAAQKKFLQKDGSGVFVLTEFEHYGNRFECD